MVTQDLQALITLRRGILHEKGWLDWYREALRRIEGMGKAGK